MRISKLMKSKKKIECKIRELRQKERLTQKDIADALDTTVDTVANWENGRANCYQFERVAKLCELLKCTAQDLISYTLDDGLDNQTLSLEEMREGIGTSKYPNNSLVNEEL